jgi:8-oxo-dGTP pyrophosphatase MutT (NUDIX family)
MTPASPFAPGEPVSPYDGFSRTPRTFDYIPQYNVATRPRTHERVAFSTLRGLIESYDIAQVAIWHRIDSIRSLEWSLVADDGYQGDVTGAVALGMAALKKPDRKNPFDAWLAEFLFDVLAFDAGALYRMRNRAGQVIGLKPVDGTILAPLLDYWGDPPEPPAPAYVQYANGLPWNWLTADDLIYQPFRKITNSPYGRAPLESILLNANTDLRFQAYFLQRYTEGNLPAAFASAPETWTPQQIESFQEYWDGFILGDQSFKNQIRWIPPGSKIEWSNEKDFTDAFSLFMMRKTLAAYHVVPADLGFTESVNKSAGETQTDVQHRIGDAPLAKHVSSILTGFLQDDLRLPLKHQFDFGEEQDDRLATAQADQVYIQNAVVSPSEIRELRFGLGEPDGRPVPRYIFSSRGGAVPLAPLFAVAGPIDPASGAPLPGAPLPKKPFSPIEGVEPNPAPPTKPLAVQIYGDLNPPTPNPVVGVAPAPHAVMPGAAAPQAAATPVAKDGAAAPAAGSGSTAGITAATGIYSYDLGTEPVIMPDADDIDYEVAKSELATYRRYVKARKRSGRWKDFEFAAIDRVTAHRLNDAGRLEIRKAGGVIACAGLAVLAEDTGRVLMLQRGLDPNDPASGTFEFPGGHVEDGETPLAAAEREFQEETGLLLSADALTNANPDATWTSADRVYRGFVVTIPVEAALPIAERGQVANPDDPDADAVEMIAWWDPRLLPANPAVRPELLASMDDVQRAIAIAQPCDTVPAEVAAPVEKAAPMLGEVPGLTKRSGMISLDLPAGLIPVVPGGLNDHHVTVVYLGKDLDDEDFAAACDRAETAATAMAGPLTGSISGRGVFPPSASSDGKIPVFAEVELPGISALHAELEDLSASEHASYHAHVTRTYAEPGDQLPDPLPYTPVTFTHLTVHRGDEQMSFPFGQRGLGVMKASGGEPDGPKADASAKEASKAWPGWEHDLQAARHWADRLNNGYTNALSRTHAERIAASFIAAHPQPKTEKKPTKAETAAVAAALLAAALAHLENQGLDLTSHATENLRGIYADGYLIGAASGNAVIDGGAPALGNWAPGKTADAHHLIETLALGAGLSALLLRAPEVAAEMSNTRMTAMATALAAGAASGSGPAVIAGTLVAVLAAGWRSLRSAITGITTGSSAGASDTYQKRGVELGQWLLDPSSKSCPNCIANANAKPRPLGQPWPSGSAYPPEHDHCRCEIGPA